MFEKRKNTSCSKYFGIPVAIFALLISIVGCGGSSDDEGTSLANRTSFRVFHASADTPSLDLLLDGTRRQLDTSFRNSTDFVDVEPGQVAVQLNVAGSLTPALEAVIDFREGTSTTLVAANFADQLETILINDDLIAPGQGLIKFRVGHFAPTAPALDFYISSPSEDLDFLSPVFTNVSYKDVGEFLQVPRGTYRLRATVAGTQVVAIDSGELNFDGERIFTVLALDTEGGGEPFSFGVIRDRPSS